MRAKSERYFCQKLSAPQRSEEASYWPKNVDRRQKITIFHQFLAVVSPLAHLAEILMGHWLWLLVIQISLGSDVIWPQGLGHS